MTPEEYYKELYEDGKNERCAICTCDLHWGKCPEGHMQVEEFSKLLPEGWTVEEYNLETPADCVDIISVRKGADRLTLTGYICEGEVALEANRFACDSRQLNPKNVRPENLDYTYLDTLLGEYTWPSELATGEAQRWFARVVQGFEKGEVLQ